MTRAVTELSLVDLKCAGYFLHCLNLSGTADTRHGYTHVDGRTDTAVEEGCLEEDLTVGDGDDVSRNVCGNVAGLSLDDREGRERTAGLHDGFEDFGKVVHLRGNFLIVDNLGSALEQT